MGKDCRCDKCVMPTLLQVIDGWCVRCIRLGCKGNQGYPDNTTVREFDKFVYEQNLNHIKQEGNK